MLLKKKISVVIPCYNEEKGIKNVMKRMPKYIDEVVVIDNNCTDNTAAVARKLGARVVREKRPGYGAAYKRGLPAARGDIIITADGDGTYPPEEIERLVKILEKEKLDFISGSRFPLQHKGAMSFTNQVGNFVLTVATAVLFLKPIRDSQSGMWIFRRKLLRKMKLTSDGMAFSEEIKIEAIKSGARFKEIHIPYQMRLGEVKLQKWRDGWQNLTFLFKKRLGMI